MNYIKRTEDLGKKRTMTKSGESQEISSATCRSKRMHIYWTFKYNSIMRVLGFHDQDMTWARGVKKCTVNKVSKAEFIFIPLLTQCSYRENKCVFNLGIYHPKLKDPKWGIEGWWRETMFTLLQLIYGI